MSTNYVKISDFPNYSETSTDNLIIPILNYEMGDYVNYVISANGLNSILNPTGTTSHNSLINIQGGDTNQYYHLSDIKYKEINNGYLTPQEETVSRKIYVTITGNDITGDGLTPETAFATIGRALDDINPFINAGVDISIMLGPGDFNLALAETKKFNKFIFQSIRNGGISIVGSYDILYSGVTCTIDPNDPFTQSATTHTFTNNEIKDCFFVNPINFTINNNYTAYPIYSNTNTVIVTTRPSAYIGNAKSIIQLTTRIFNVDNSDDFMSIPVSDYNGNVLGNVLFKALNIISSVTYHIYQDITLQSCIFDNTSGNNTYCDIYNPHNSITNNIFKFYFTDNNNRGFYRCSSISNCVFDQTNSSQHGDLNWNIDFGSILNCLLANFQTAIEFGSSLNGSLLTISNLKMINCLYAFNFGHYYSSTIKQSIGSKLVIENVSYILYSTNDTVNCQFYIDNLYGTPTIAMSLRSSGSFKMIDPSRNRFIRIPGYYGEYSNEQYLIWNNNSSGTIAIGKTGQTKSITIDYNIERNGVITEQTDKIYYVNNNLTVITGSTINIPTTGSTGVSLSYSVAADSTINLNRTVSNSIDNATVHYNITRFLR